MHAARPARDEPFPTLATAEARNLVPFAAIIHRARSNARLPRQDWTWWAAFYHRFGLSHFGQKVGQLRCVKFRRLRPAGDLGRERAEMREQVPLHLPARRQWALQRLEHHAAIPLPR
jgi:hypothetical protein